MSTPIPWTRKDQTMSEPLPSSQDALAGIWKGIRDISRILGEPIPGEGASVIIDGSEYIELKKIEYAVRAAKPANGENSSIGVHQFDDSLNRLDVIRYGYCDE